MTRKPDRGSPNLRPRVYAALGLFFLLFAVIFLRAFELQVLDSPVLKSMAEGQHRKTISVQSKRGDIYDRNSRELAVSVEVDSVFAQPQKVSSPRAAARRLSKALSMEPSEIMRILSADRGFVWIKRQVDLKEDARRMIASIEGVGIMKESRRFYPNSDLASNVIGFTGTDSNGLEGIERRYDTLLKGVSSKYTGDRDAMGRTMLFEDMDKLAPLEGMEVELTIDKTIQYIAEKELKKAVEKAGARGGAAIVMDPSTGEVLAMANYPTFDPNDFKRTAPGRWRNRAVTDLFEPGSTFKLFLVSAALEENAVRPRDSFYCENGSYRVKDRVFHDVKKHGWLTVSGIIKHSSNIGSAKIAEKIGKARLHRYLRSFGFGDKTGVDLPGEAAGSLPELKKWSDVTLSTVSFGQGVSSTGIQLVTALSSIANGGFVMKPYVVRAVKDPKGGVVSESNPVILRRVVSESTARRMTEMLIAVTEDGGTGTRAAVEGFEVAGKTGTAQKPDLKDGGYMDGAFISSFMGFVPARSPRLSILVVIDEPEGDTHGGVVAAPVFKEIASQSLAYLGVFPETPDRFKRLPVIEANGAIPAHIQRASYEKRVETDGDSPYLEGEGVPDFTGMTVRMALKTAKEKGIEVEVIGNGRAVFQRPQSGKAIPAKGPVSVWFKD